MNNIAGGLGGGGWVVVCFTLALLDAEAGRSHVRRDFVLWHSNTFIFLIPIGIFLCSLLA